MDPVQTLVDRDVLPADINAALDSCFEPGETIELVLPGLDASAIIGTDRRVFMSRRGELVTNAATGKPAAWAYGQFRRIQFESDRIAGTLVLMPADPADRGLILLFDAGTMALAKLGAHYLRGKLQEAGSYEPVDGEVAARD